MEYTINGTTVSRELHDLYEMACHNLLCYSANYLMTEPKAGFDVEWAAAVLEVDRLITLAAETSNDDNRRQTLTPATVDDTAASLAAIGDFATGPVMKRYYENRRQSSPALTPPVTVSAEYAVAVEIETTNYLRHVAMSDAFEPAVSYGALDWCRFHMVQAAESLQRLQSWAANPAGYDFSDVCEFADVCEVTA